LIIYHLILSHIEKSTWYQSGTGLDSLMGGPSEMENYESRRIDYLLFVGTGRAMKCISVGGKLACVRSKTFCSNTFSTSKGFSVASSIGYGCQYRRILRLKFRSTRLLARYNFKIIITTS
jgi:hypothetical protein